MATSFTRQTPPATRLWMAKYDGAFAEFSTLDAVAEECHRRYLSKRLDPINASRSVAAWAARKLAVHRDFTAEHWDWLCAEDRYRQCDGYSRLSDIVTPAVAATPTWRKTEIEREAALQEIDKAAAHLLEMMGASLRLDVGLKEVTGWNPEMQLLFDRSRELMQHKMDRGLKAARDARSAGLGLAAVISASLPPDGYREPRLSDYLWTLRAAIRGKLGNTHPSADEGVQSILDELSPEDGAKLSNRLGITTRSISLVESLRAGGDFGAYPKRRDALRRAVVLAFPGAIFDRMTDMPKVAPANMIEVACVAWFGNSPTQKEINGMIKPERDRLVPAMKRQMAAIRRAAAIEAKMAAQGLSADDIKRKRLLSFLDDDDLP